MSKFPGWRTMTGAERRNAKMHAIFEKAKRLGAFDGPAPGTIAQGERASAPDYDPTCVLCESGEAHEH